MMKFTTADRKRLRNRFALFPVRIGGTDDVRRYIWLCWYQWRWVEEYEIRFERVYEDERYEDQISFGIL